MRDSWYPLSSSLLCQIPFTGASEKQDKKTGTKVLKAKKRDSGEAKPYPHWIERAPRASLVFWML